MNIVFISSLDETREILFKEIHFTTHHAKDVYGHEMGESCCHKTEKS